MLTLIASLVLATPFSPALVFPNAEGWTLGSYFETSDYADDAGVPPGNSLLEVRRDDAGYGAIQQTQQPYSVHYFSVNFPLLPEGARWCWRVRHTNTLGQSSTSAERCFRTDWTRPSSPVAVDAGAVVSQGLVQIAMQPATDTPSGVFAYCLELGSAPVGDFYEFPDPELSLPLVAYVGEGAWFGWIKVLDFVGNDNGNDFGGYTVPITITADSTVPRPPAPRFENMMTSEYGDSLLSDAVWALDAGATHVVSSFCDLDAGCLWRHGFHTVPVAQMALHWLQMPEGWMVARVAVVRGGKVGPWSAPSTPIALDRTPPSIPTGLTVLPSAARAGPFVLSWGPVLDTVTGFAGVMIEERQTGTSNTRAFSRPPGTSASVTPAMDGRFEFRVASFDRVNNHSDWSAPVSVLLDSTGPVSTRPTSVASPVDGGAMVSITWSLPVDALSTVASQDLLELSVDGGTQLIRVTGLSVARVVPPGSWRWQLRGTDSLGNQGPFSEPSTVIAVTSTGVSVGPAIVSTTVPAQCGQPLSVDLQATGTPVITWTLISGPAGAALDTKGHLSWTPPAENAVVERVQVKLRNVGGEVTGVINVDVACASASDGGLASPRVLMVGCGCSSGEGLAVLALCALLFRRH